MQQRGTLVIAVVVALVIGIGIGIGVYRPQLSSVEGAQQEQETALAAVRERVGEREARVESLLQEIGGVRADRAKLSVELETATDALAAARGAFADVDLALGGARSTIAEQRSALDAAGAQRAALEDELRAVQALQGTIDEALDLQADLLAVVSDGLNPNLADGDLLSRQGNRAANNGTFEAAAAYYEASGAAFDVAKTKAEVAAAKSKALFLLVPDSLRGPFSTTHKQAEATVRAAGAQALTAQAAAALYTLIAEWQQSEDGGSQQEKDLWSDSSDAAEVLLEGAMTLLDEAAEWAPDLWRQFAAIRIQVRDQQNLLAAIRFIILEEP